MGSLPNLHELSRESDSENSPALRHTVPIAGPQQIVPHHHERVQHVLTQPVLPSMQTIHKYHGHARICRTRSNGNHNHLYDDVLLEQLATYSPISSRSSRTLAAHHNVTNAHMNSSLNNHTIGRRRESLNSSIGATSVRRLIAVVRNTSGRSGPLYSRQILIRNVIALCVSHAFISAAYKPLLALQSSVSAWHWPLKHSFVANLDLGAILLSILYVFASFSSLASPIFVQKFGTNVVFVVGYVVFAIFFGAHLFPIVYILFPAYVMLGLVLGPVTLSRVTFVMTLASKMSYIATDDEEIEEHHRSDTRRTCLIRRLARALQGAQDIGLMIGSIITALLISYTINKQFELLNNNQQLSSVNNSTIVNNSYVDVQSFDNQQLSFHSNDKSPHVGSHHTNQLELPPSLILNSLKNISQISNSTTTATTTLNYLCNNMTEETNCSISQIDDVELPKIEEHVHVAVREVYFASYDDLFDVDDNGDRICGSNACPLTLYFNFNVTNRELIDNFIYILPPKTSTMLTCVYLACATVAFVLAGVGLDRIRLYVYHDALEKPMGLSILRAVKDTFKDVKLQLAAPLAVFIGLEQGFMYADFSKSYVLCALGVNKVNLVFLSMGLLQSISAFTLSMLLKTIRRYIVIAVGFAFHACLIMVLRLWKPSGDDPALFYVIAAAWGVCNSIWEMLNFTFLTGHYSDNWEPAFANSTFFRFLGLALAFGFHGLLCNWIKLYILAVSMVVAILPYTFLEMKLENTRKLKSISRL